MVVIILDSALPTRRMRRFIKEDRAQYQVKWTKLKIENWFE